MAEAVTTLFMTREEAAAHPETINGRAALLDDARLLSTFSGVYLRTSEPPLPPRWPFPGAGEESCLHPWCYGWLAAFLIEEQLKRDLIGGVRYVMKLHGATLRGTMTIQTQWLGIEKGARIPRFHRTEEVGAWALWNHELRRMVDYAVREFQRDAYGIVRPKGGKKG